jgi:HEAT repeat protein
MRIIRSVLGGLAAMALLGGTSSVLAHERPAPVASASADEHLLAVDQADSLYREARTALNRGDYDRAARLFRDIRRRYPDSGYVPNSYYWEAFALYRTASEENLQRALELIERQGSDYPNASTRGDARQLSVRVAGALASGGDAAAAEWVVELAAPAAAPAPAGVPAPGAGIGQQQREEDDIAIAALNALMQMDADRAMPILEKVLARRDAGSVELRRKAVFIVAQQDTDESAQILLNAARNDPDADVRANAVFWLSQVEGEEAVIALDSILQFSTDRQVQEKAIFALSQHESERSDQALRSYVQRDDVPEDLQHSAIFWIGQTDSEENMEFLRQLFGRLQSDRLRERVIFALAQSESEENSRWLMDVALDPNQSIEMRKKALFWAGQMDEISVSDLARLYDSMTDQELRGQILFVLSQRDEPEAIDKLMEIARSDANPEFRRKALFWLGQSDDPRIAEFLLEIINQEGQ